MDDLEIKVTHDQQRVRIDIGSNVSEIELSPNAAEDLARQIRLHAQSVVMFRKGEPRG